MAYTYSTYIDAISAEVRIPLTNVDLQRILPTIIDQAEQMIYRDLDLIATVITDSSGPR